MKKYLNYFIIFLFIFASCSIFDKNKKEYFRFNNNSKTINIIEFEYIKKKILVNDTISNMQIFEKNDSLFLIALKRGTNKILKYDLNNNTKKTINFNKEIKKIFNLYPNLYSCPDNIKYINKDTIFLMYSRQINGNHDSIFFLGNEKGEIIKSYSLKGAHVQSIENPVYNNNDDAVIWMPNIFQPPIFYNNKLFLHFVSNAPYLGDYPYKDLPVAGYIDTKINKYFSIDINYPSVNYEKTFYNNFNKYFFSVISHDNNILYGFKYTPELIKYNIKNGKKKYVKIKSTIYDTIYPALSEKEIIKGLEYDMPYPSYMALQYDKYRNLYYRFISMPKQYGKANYTLIAADTSFNTIAEGFPPLKKSPLFFITKKYLITFDAFNDNDKKNNIYTFYFYKIKFRTGTNQELITEIKTREKHRHKKKTNKSLVNYLSKYGHIKKTNYIATIISEEETCEGTMDFVLQHYKKNIEKYNKYNVYLFIQSGNKNEIKKLLSTKYKLYLNKYSNIIIDTTFTYSSYVNFKVNDIPRIIKVRDNKIVADTIFQLDDAGIINMQKFLINSGKEQQRILENEKSKSLNTF